MPGRDGWTYGFVDFLPLFLRQLRQLLLTLALGALAFAFLPLRVAVRLRGGGGAEGGDGADALGGLSDGGGVGSVGEGGVRDGDGGHVWMSGLRWWDLWSGGRIAICSRFMVLSGRFGWGRASCFVVKCRWESRHRCVEVKTFPSWNAVYEVCFCHCRVLYVGDTLLIQSRV